MGQVKCQERLFPAVALGMVLGFSAPGMVIDNALWWVAWCGLSPLLWHVWKGENPLSTFCQATLFGFGYFGISHGWVFSLHPMTWLGLSLWQSGLAAGITWLLLTGGWALAWGIFFGVLAGMVVGLRRLPLSSTHLNTLCLLGIPIAWVGWHHWVATADLGIPWAMVAYTQVDLPLARGVVERLGTDWLTGLLVFNNVLLALTWHSRQKTLRLLALVMPVLMAVSLWQPALTFFKGAKAETTRTVPIHWQVLQKNLSIQAAHPVAGNEPLSMDKNPYWQALFQINREKAAQKVLFLPEEGIVEGWVNEKNPLENSQISWLQHFANQKKVSVVLGLGVYTVSLRNSFTGYNALGVITPFQPVQFYKKQRLVPFGEMLPAPFAWLGTRNIQQGMKQAGVDYDWAFTPGKAKQPLPVIPAVKAGDAPVKLGGLICFELVYPELARAHQQNGARLLVNSSNLGWFHENPWMKAQFLAIARFRALETHLPLVMAANTGPSAWIDEKGNILWEPGF